MHLSFNSCSVNVFTVLIHVYCKGKVKGTVMPFYKFIIIGIVKRCINAVASCCKRLNDPFKSLLFHS